MGASNNKPVSGVPATGAAAGAPAKAPGSPVKTLGFFGFFAITASMVMTVYAYPNFASSGMHLIFFLILGGVFWFLPVALCAAEMATVKGWESGGIFAWVGNTLGKRWGFAALFYQGFQITVGFVTMAFLCGGLRSRSWAARSLLLALLKSDSLAACWCPPLC